MKIAGLQKLTLLDFPGETACIVFTPGCNFNCPYCHNSHIIHHNHEEMPLEEFFKFLESRKGLLDGVVVSGGEPTLQKDLDKFLYEIKRMGFKVKLDTNGTRPAVLEDLIEHGLVDYIAMDVKNCPSEYIKTCGTADMTIFDIQDSIKLLKKWNGQYEFRTTVVKELHSANTLSNMAKWLQRMFGKFEVPKLYLQKFVKSDTVVYELTPPSDSEMELYKTIVSKYVPNVEIR